MLLACIEVGGAAGQIELEITIDSSGDLARRCSGAGEPARAAGADQPIGARGALNAPRPCGLGPFRPRIEPVEFQEPMAASFPAQS